MSSLVKLKLAERSYRIEIGAGVLEGMGSTCASMRFGEKCLLVTDRHVGPRYGTRCEGLLRQAGFDVACMEVPARESSKSRKWLFALYDAALAHGMGRDSFFVALGGGMIGDLTGYAAASYMRGLRFIQVPTSLLAMVDSSVGGKTGINLPQGKNLVGAFHQPAAVFADLDVLESLPGREYRSGLAEVVKYGLIEDACFFHKLEKSGEALLAREPRHLERVIARCCQIKAEVVGFDEKEKGLRAILNFGHTLGHALENCCGYGRLLHGEAIAIGMMFAAHLSSLCLDLPADVPSRLGTLLTTLRLPTTPPPGLDFTHLLDAMTRDKKNTDKTPAFVLARRIGLVEPGHRVPPARIKEAWKRLTDGAYTPPASRGEPGKASS